MGHEKHLDGYHADVLKQWGWEMMPDQTRDQISPALRAAEQQIDSAHLSNPLMRLPFAEAAWYFLAMCEERIILPMIHAMKIDVSPSICEQTAIADNVINHAKWPLYWLSCTCAEGGRIPTNYAEDRYTAAFELSELSRDYLPFEAAFTHASHGVLRLRLDGRVIRPSGEMRDDTRFDAYDRILDMQAKDTVLLDPPDRLAQLVAPSVRVDGEQFTYRLTPRLVQQAMDWARPTLDDRFALPIDWELTEYSLGQYARVLKVLWTISAVHFAARLLAATQGCLGLGFAGSLVVMKTDELVRRLVRYAGCSDAEVRAIVRDLTHGARGQRIPDPALQPLVRLTNSTYGWSPNLVVGNALERNLVVLMNRIPEARAIYSRLNHEKESLLRDRFLKELADCGWRTWHGVVPGWGKNLDLDLALISDSEKACLYLELKSFIAPAESREVIERSQEIARGIEQIRIRRAELESNPQPVHEALDITPDYAVSWAVASENSIGGAWVQAEDVPVINAGHLIRRLHRSRSIAKGSKWLERRSYLPVEGSDYAVRDEEITVGGWTLEWFAIQIRVDSLP